ncbi:alpha/beta fold hydrolase [Mycobacterium sp. SM1]|uniref:alpha/beta fold hydrolase n=1 Tax=Mycobacterium sp. SM1 TaxID=2816243 RepID=UPI001BCD3D46|nr:alpha/beta hydrolase [Mycobacterium sp. SM1]MBS4727973.1 alpha/beta fold hydrolase [Mycobacterium sp. SM1]
MTRPPADGGATDTIVVSVHGLRIAARVGGSGEPVLLLNGLARPMHSWVPFASWLPGRTVITYDGPGVGASDTPILPLPMPTLADIATRVLDAVGVGSADVVGFSHGGAIAQQLAASHADRVNRLVLLATSCGAGAIPGRGRDAVRLWMARRRATPWARPDPLGVLWQLVAITTWSSIPLLARIGAPTLVVCGKHDRTVPPANSALLAARIPGAHLVTIPAGHDLQKPGPAAVVARLVDRFLRAGSRMATLSSPES